MTMWRRFRGMTSQCANTRHTTQLACDPRRSRFIPRRAGSITAAARIAEPSSRDKEKCMKLIKTSAIALAASALLAGPVLAQGASSNTHIRGGAGVSGPAGTSGGAHVGSGVQTRPGSAGVQSGAKGTVGSGAAGAARGTVNGSAGAAGSAGGGMKR
jgi:hypothetical protein